VLRNIPLLIIPFIIFNLGLTGLFGSAAQPDLWATVLLSTSMMSGGTWNLTLGDVLILLTLVLLFAEVIKSTRTSTASVVDHLLSTFVFVAFLVEFLLVRDAAHSIFFIMMIVALFDVLAGFSISLRAAKRDVSLSEY
jgi:hypothetical protein